MWEYTPRQIKAFLELAAQRRKLEIVELLTTHTMAAQGDTKTIKKMIKDLTRDV